LDVINGFGDGDECPRTAFILVTVVPGNAE